MTIICRIYAFVSGLAGIYLLSLAARALFSEQPWTDKNIYDQSLGAAFIELSVYGIALLGMGIVTLALGELLRRRQA